MSTEPLDFPVSWEELHRNARALARRLMDIRDLSEWKGIVAVTRGGMVPACIVARELDIKMIENFCISSYDHDEQREARVLMTPEHAGRSGGAGWLVIDDLVDTGNTFRKMREMLPDAHYACIYAKPEGVDSTDTFITEISQDTWVHFPWDMTVQYCAPLVAQKEE